MTSANSFNS